MHRVGQVEHVLSGGWVSDSRLVRCDAHLSKKTSLGRLLVANDGYDGCACFMAIHEGFLNKAIELLPSKGACDEEKADRLLPFGRN